jgi:ABC-type amino acid transport substrate-binding protein
VCKTSLHTVFVFLLALAAGFMGAHLTPRGGAVEPVRETTYERVMRTGTIRCAYILYPTFLDKDINTGALSGIFYDIVNEVGKQLSLKVEWVEQVGFSNAFEGFKTGRYDIIASGFTPTPGRARVAEFTTPTSYIPFYAYVRTDDKRFDNNTSKINDSSVTVAVMEGQLSQVVKEEDFPKAKILSLPNMAEDSQVFLQVEMNKADVAMAEPATAQVYIDRNPSKIRRLEGQPLRMQPISIPVPVGEESLKSMINTTLQTLLGTGFIRRTYARHAAAQGFFFPPAQPWGIEEK